MTALVMLGLLLIGTLMAARLRRDRESLLRATGIVMLLLAAVVLVLALTGLPLFRVRVRGVPSGIVGAEWLQEVHYIIGRQSLLTLGLFGPMFVVAALAHRRGWRRVAHASAAIALVLLWAFVTFAGYLLPAHLPHPIPRKLVSTVLRFAVLHVFLIPTLVFALLVVAGLRHLRQSAQEGLRHRAVRAAQDRRGADG